MSTSTNEWNRITTTEQIQQVCHIAEEIWREHYIPIIGESQVDYMLDKFQSPHAVSNQIQQQGYSYYFITYEDQSAGYLAFKLESDKMFLSKIYVMKQHRGKRLAGKAIAFLVEQCKQRGLRSIYLTVNKRNASSIAAYERLGFVKVQAVVADIGNGYVMDDDVMEKVVV